MRIVDNPKAPAVTSRAFPTAEPATVDSPVAVPYRRVCAITKVTMGPGIRISTVVARQKAK